jgi:CRP/FNR family transcriptional regulator, cyclic AMP receptor protein
MLELARLKSIGILSELNDQMLKKVGDKARILKVNAGEYVFKEGDKAENLYSVVEGKIVLEVLLNSSTNLKIKEIVPTRSFGISSMVETEVRHCVSHAKATEDSRLLVWKASDLEDLFQSDHNLGYLLTKKVAKVLKDRLQSTYAQAAVIE